MPAIKQLMAAAWATVSSLSGSSMLDINLDTANLHDIIQSGNQSFQAKHGTVTESPIFTTKDLHNLTTSFLDSFMYPRNIEQARLINSTYFAPNVQGRVDATRTFDGAELNTEYLYGLFNPPNTTSFFTLLGLPIAYKVTHFAAKDNIASAAIINTFNVSTVGATLPLEVDLWLTFNSARQISQYDATFRYLAWEFDALFDLGVQKSHLPLAALKLITTQRLAKSICDVAQTHCKGENQQYANHASCMAHLMLHTRFGQAYELGMDTLLCRMVHRGMVGLRPDVHCSHVGPTGGEYCKDDRTYEGAVREEYFRNTPFVPRGLQ